MKNLKRKNLKRKALKRHLIRAACVGLIFGLLGQGGPAEAARTYGLDPRVDSLGEITGSSLIRRIQESLRAIGFYTGPVDGQANELLREAIRQYQKRTGLEVDGRATEALASRLETGQKIEDLLERLRESREEKMQQAREALAANPETARLIDPNRAPDKADPTRDVEGCFAEPTPACLLFEASESSKIVSRRDMRDWALGELLIAQTRAGLDGEAMTTAARIADPRLIIVALTDIAQHQARTGRMAAALDASRLIPDPLRKADALFTVARLKLMAGSDIQDLVDRLTVTLSTLPDDIETLRRQLALASLEIQAGLNGKERIATLQGAATALEDEGERRDRLRLIAGALAETGETDAARTLYEAIGLDESDIALRLTTANLNGAGSGGATIETADAIQAGRYRAVALARIAESRARAGEEASAREALERAAATVEEITLSYATSYARARIAQAQLALADLTGEIDEALAAMEAIKDPALRATELWRLVGYLTLKGETERARAITTLAETTSDKIISRVSRVWVHADFSEAMMRHNQTALAQSAFERGLAVARTIKNPWGRTRALARLAQALSTLHREALPDQEGSSK
ncbi:MAG: peptidoglycan-binding domain-containing protein [Magnetovibrionaceae bacterium]